MQEQQANNAPESDNASQANTTSEGDASSQDSQATMSTEEAQAAYQVVIDDYKSAIAEYAAAGSTYDKDAFSEKHPPIFRDRNIDCCLDASRGTLSYSFATFKEGEPPVLLIKSAQGSTSEDANSVQLVAAYVLVDNEPTIAVETGHDGSSLTLINEKMLRWFTIGAGQTGKSVKQNLYFSVSTTSNDNQNREVKSNPSTGWEGKMTSSSIEGVSVFTKAPSCINVIGLITSPMTTESTEITVTHPDGSTTTSSEGSGQAEQSLETECLNACEQSLNLSWQPLA